MVLCAAGYAALLGLGRARRQPALARAALGAYARDSSGGNSTRSRRRLRDKARPLWQCRHSHAESYFGRQPSGPSKSHPLVFILLTFHSLAAIQSDVGRVPAYSAINHRIDYRFDEERGYQVPVIGDEVPLFGRKLSETEAERLVDLGKLTVQAKNCMNCHTLLGNGACYAPTSPRRRWTRAGATSRRAS